MLDFINLNPCHPLLSFTTHCRGLWLCVRQHQDAVSSGLLPYLGQTPLLLQIRTGPVFFRQERGSSDTQVLL